MCDIILHSIFPQPFVLCWSTVHHLLYIVFSISWNSVQGLLVWSTDLILNFCLTQQLYNRVLGMLGMLGSWHQIAMLILLTSQPQWELGTTYRINVVYSELKTWSRSCICSKSWKLNLLKIGCVCCEYIA